jgi:hypothetical protein
LLRIRHDATPPKREKLCKQPHSEGQWGT